jgi:hypothetical protein
MKKVRNKFTNKQTVQFNTEDRRNNEHRFKVNYYNVDFYPEDGGDMFLRNVSSHKIYTVPHPRRRHSSFIQIFNISIELS